MDNAAYSPEPDEVPAAPQEKISHDSYLANEMKRIRETIDPNTFCAPLNQGQPSAVDKFNLAFLIIFPCFFFALGIILTAVLS